MPEEDSFPWFVKLLLIYLLIAVDFGGRGSFRQNTCRTFRSLRSVHLSHCLKNKVYFILNG